MTADDHGTNSTYTNHHCRCDRCRDAMANYHAEWKRRQLGKPLPDDRHGRYSTYSNLGCRCDKCKAANTAYAAAKRAKR